MRDAEALVNIGVGSWQDQDNSVRWRFYPLLKNGCSPIIYTTLSHWTGSWEISVSMSVSDRKESCGSQGPTLVVRVHDKRGQQLN